MLPTSDRQTCTRTDLEQLIELLDSDDPARIEPQLYALAAKLPTQAFNNMIAAVDEFDFPAAIATTLLTELFNEEK